MKPNIRTIKFFIMPSLKLPALGAVLFLIAVLFSLEHPKGGIIAGIFMFLVSTIYELPYWFRYLDFLSDLRHVSSTPEVLGEMQKDFDDASSFQNNDIRIGDQYVFIRYFGNVIKRADVPCFSLNSYSSRYGRIVHLTIPLQSGETKVYQFLGWQNKAQAEECVEQINRCLHKRKTEEP